MEKKANWMMVAFCAIVCCAVLGGGLIGMGMSSPDTHLKDVTPNHITNNNYHVTPDTMPGVLPKDTPQQLSPQPSHLHQATYRTGQNVATYQASPQPQTVYVQASPEPVPQQKIIYVEQPRPEPIPDTTIVIYKPEVRQPQQRIVVIDERQQRLQREHDELMRNWTAPATVVVK